jgi:Temperature dependent protein affecting M2 dsRNA replication
MKWFFKLDLRDHKNFQNFAGRNFHETFTDACILAGGAFDCPPIPNLAGTLDSMGPVFHFERAVDLMRTYAHGVLVIRELCGNDDRDYMDKFCRTKAILTYMPVMGHKGQVQTFSQKNIPNDLATVVTPRFANEIYTYLSRRLVGTSMYDFLISDRQRIQAPLDGGESLEYQTLLHNMIPLKVDALGLLASHSNRFFHHKHLVSRIFDLAYVRLSHTGIGQSCKMIFLHITYLICRRVHMEEQKHGVFHKR